MDVDKEYSPITSTPAPAPPRKRNGGTKSRQSLRKTLTIEASNDDDAERSTLAGYEQQEAAVVGVATPTRSMSSESNQSLSLTPQKEHYEGCLKLFAENKITRENAWNLRLIDYMTTMLRRRDARMEDLQTASVLVEASARIYGARVDSLHHDVLVMAGGLNKAAHSKRGKKNDDIAEEEGLAPEGPGGGGAALQKKKKKRLKGATATNPDALAGDFETNLSIDPFFEMLCATSGDVTSSSRAFHGTLRVHDRTMALILRTDAPFLEPEEESGAGPGAGVRVVVPRELVASARSAAGSPLCDPFRGFDLCHWDPDAEDSEYRRYLGAGAEDGDGPLDLSHQAVAFDVDADVEPIPADTDHHYNEEEEAGGADSGVEEEGVVMCARGPPAPPPRLVDMRPGAADSRLEYSYCGVITAAWAGPSHWRLKHNRASHSLPSRRGGASGAGPTRPAPTRRQPEFLGAGLAWDWRTPPPDYEPAPHNKIMISRKTLATAATWNEDNYKTPVDRGLDESFFRALFSRRRVLLQRRRRGSGLGLEPGPEPEVDPEVEPARDYDYENENDASYCPLHVQAGDSWGPADGTAEPPPRPALHPADEPIEPPPKIPKVFIPYALRAKKVDMKQLKQCTWKTLTEGGGEVESTTFLSVYGRVSRRLGGTAREALSVPLALLALLHLANERGLDLQQRTDLADIDVHPLQNTLHTQ